MQIDRYVLDQFHETRKKRLPVKDFTLQQWGAEAGEKVKILAHDNLFQNFFLLKIRKNTTSFLSAAVLVQINFFCIVLGWSAKFRSFVNVGASLQKKESNRIP